MGRRFFIKWYVFVSVLAPLLLEVKGYCYNNFDFTSASLTPDNPVDGGDNYTVIIRCKIPERTELEKLYTVWWNVDLGTPPHNDDNDDNTAMDYMEFDTSTEAIDVSLFNSIEGLIDYGGTPQRTTELEITYYFDFDGGEKCALLLTHDIEDENTKEPVFHEKLYNLTIREDYPIFYQVPNFQPSAVDYDVISPNIDFNIATDENCPLDVIPPAQFQTSGGEWTTVAFQLNRRLDYDTMEEPYQFTCTVMLTDHGVPTKQNTSEIKLTVEPYSDEEPSLNDIMYQAFLSDMTEGTLVEIQPRIEATDADKPTDELTYSMTDLDTNVKGSNYFSINETTAEVYIIKDIDDPNFLANERIFFAVNVFDGTFISQNSFLSISLSSDGTSLEFDKLTYSVERISPPKDDLLLTVHATGPDSGQEILYSFEFSESSGAGNFSLDSTSGEIRTVENETPPGNYWLDVNAESGNEDAKTKVNILIDLAKEYAPYVTNSLYDGEIREGDEPGPTEVTVTAEGASFYCIEATEPKEFEGLFEISSDGSISTTDYLDADNATLGNEITLKVAAYLISTTCDTGSINDDLMRNEALVEYLIIDENDNEPVFVDENGNSIENMIAAFPVVKSLQRAAGSVARIQAIDMDSSSVISYSLSNSEDGVHFKVDSDTGIIYFTADEMECEDNCVLSLSASDETSQDTLTLTILPLEMDLINTMTLTDTDLEDVDKSLLQISTDIGVDLRQLYSSVLDSSTKSDTWNVEVQVYALKEGVLLTLDELNEYLNDGAYDSALVFSEKEDFSQDVTVIDPTDVTGYQIAVGILGAIVGIIILVSVAFLCIKQSKERRGKTSEKSNKTAENNKGFSKNETDETFSSIFIDNYSTVGSKILDVRKQSSVSNLFSSSSSPESRKSSSHDIKESPKNSDRKDSVISDMKNEFPPSIKKDSVELSQAIVEIHKEADKNDITIPSISLPDEKSQNHNGGESVSSIRSNSITHHLGSSVSGSRKGSILKDDLSLIGFDEPKSVAFKVLVDTAEFDVDSPSKEDEWEQLRL